MNVLIVGVPKSRSGAWVMRGEQLGAAIGARVTTQPTAADWRWASLIVLVKRAAMHWIAQAKATKVPIVWDALDCWRQPGENSLNERQARALLQAKIATLKPALTIAATHAMAEACGGVCVPHHSWAGLSPTPARASIQVVAYQGNPIYLGTWKRHLEQLCTARGWRFVINPPDLREADLIV